MYVKVIPEVWNTLTAMQKRSLAENVQYDDRPRVDLAEVAAWASTVLATMAVVAFAAILLR